MFVLVNGSSGYTIGELECLLQWFGPHLKVACVYNVEGVHQREKKKSKK